MYELTSIAFSHYVEKARWALDRFAVPYRDHRYLPLFHFPAVYRLHGGRAGRADKVSSRLSTPVLRVPSGALLCDSAEIVRHVSDQFAAPGQELYPTPEVAVLERHLHDELGPHTRRCAYGVLFDNPTVLREFVRRNVGRLQAGAFNAALPLVIKTMRAALAVSDEQVSRSIDKVRREMAAISERLADGRQYLVGERFSAADLTFACMAAPTLFPPEYSAWLPAPEGLPLPARSLCAELRATPAGAHALRMFSEERRRVLRAPA
jgi:glutathione S-transferase